MASILAEVAPSISKRDELIHLAYEVFSEYGFHSTGVDKLLDNSGVSKRTLYKYFRTKEDLISAAINYYQQKTMTQVEIELSRYANDPKGKLLALFDMKEEELSNPEYCGCFAINARLVYEGDHPEIKKASADFISTMHNYVEQLCKDAGCEQPSAIATKIMVQYVGTIVLGQSQKDPAIARASKDIVASLLA